ncbi:MAG: RNA pseudouridine synthase [Mucinivorans sp.]
MDILFEDNHVIVVNKHSGELVQPDPSGAPALEQAVAEYVRVKYNKPGRAFLGVVHRLDRPVSGAVLFARTSKALVRLNEQLRERGFRKLYWAIVEQKPTVESATLTHHIVRNAKTNKSMALDSPTKDSQEAVLKYRLVKSSDRYHLLEVELLTGRHHQIRAQLAAIGCKIKGDLKYGASRSNPDGSISLHSRSLEFSHPVTRERIVVTAPVPEDKLWQFFEHNE